MTTHNYTNTASIAQLGGNMDAITTALSVAPGTYTGWPAAPFWGLIARGTASVELVEVTNVAGTTLTVVRAQGGLSASSHSTGDTFEHIIPAALPADYELHKAASSGVHGVSGDVVGTAGSQTLQDKTFRGAHRSVFSDALPAGVSASFESVADNANARDGFVHRSTLGDVDRRALLTEQSGSPRVQVFNDGTVKLSPGASARPGLENDGTTQLDGAVSVNSTLNVTGTSTLAGVNAGAVSAASVSSAGSIAGPIAGTTGSFSGAVALNGATTVNGVLSVNANADLNNDLNVDGAFTPRTVTVQPVVGGDITPRVTVRTNTTTDALRVESNAAVLQLAITGGGGINTIGNIFTLGSVTAAGHLFAENSTIPVIPVVTSLASVTSPVTNMLVFLTTDGLLYRRTATPAWVVHDRVIRRLGSRGTDTPGVQVAGIGATETNIPKLAFENSAVVNDRWYDLALDLSAQFSAADNSFMVRVRKDTALIGAVVAQWEWVTTTAGFTHTKMFRKLWKCTADDADFDAYVSIQRISGAGTCDLNGAGNSTFSISEDTDGTVHTRVA